jgi:hypothetical protein
MTPESVFTAMNFTAMAGWALLAAGVVFNNATLRDLFAGRIVPTILATAYTVLILLHWTNSQGGFSSLAGVASLFANPWLLLAGWVHYLAFDLAIGALIARKTFDQGLPRLILLPILPLTFLFGPIGWLIFEAACLAAPRFNRKATA